MSYRLVITEKPSVAQAYAKVLGATSRQDSYLEGGGYLVSWCVGHLVELAPPNLYDEKYVKWSVADLPILPEKWQYLVSASTKRQFGVLKKLMHREDVESIVCATDAGREGELIFRLVYQQAGCKKPVSRLWLSSMEDAAIREGFARLKPSTEYGWPGHDAYAGHDSRTRSCDFGLCSRKILYGRTGSGRGQHCIQQAFFAESRCRSTALCLSKGGKHRCAESGAQGES